jgi:hypothetical protein
MAVLAEVGGVTDITVTNPVLEYLVPVVSIPGWSSAVVPAMVRSTAMVPAMKSDVISPTANIQATAQSNTFAPDASTFTPTSASTFAPTGASMSALDDYTQMMQREKDDKLLTAARDGDIVTVQRLLAAGANVHVLSDQPLKSAAKNGYAQVVKMLLQAGANAHDGKALIDAV